MVEEDEKYSKQTGVFSKEFRSNGGKTGHLWIDFILQKEENFSSSSTYGK